MRIQLLSTKSIIITLTLIQSILFLSLFSKPSIVLLILPLITAIMISLHYLFEEAQGSTKAKINETIIFFLIFLFSIEILLLACINVTQDYLGFNFLDIDKTVSPLVFVLYVLIFFGIPVLSATLLKPLTLSLLNILNDVYIKIDKKSRTRLLCLLLMFFSITLAVAVLYHVIYSNDSTSFFSSHNKLLKFHDFVYFSIVTITTLGYGDIHPVSLTAKLIVTVEVIIGVFLIIGYLSFVLSQSSRKNS